MSKIEEKLKKLESKIDRLSKQLRDTRKAIIDANKVVLDIVGNYMKGIGKLSTEQVIISEKSRAKRGELERKTERRTYYRGLIVGLALGIFGNLFVSYWMEYLKACNIPSWGWILGVVVGILLLVCIVWQLHIKAEDD